MADDSRNVAVLIDFENLNDTKSLKKVLARGGELGRVVVKRAVGDFSSNGDKSQTKLRELGILPVQQATAGKGKNSSDMRLAIEAVSLSHDPVMSIDVFIVATSDADFLPLAQWLRASGKHVVGTGRSDASNKWQKGVDEFVVVKKVKAGEAAVKSTAASKPKAAAKSKAPTTTKNVKTVESKSTAEAAKSKTKAQPQKPKQLTRKYRSLVNRTVHELFKDGIDSVTDGQFNAQIRKLDSDFSCKKAGFTSLRKLIASVDTLYVPPEPRTGAFKIQLRDRKS